MAKFVGLQEDNEVSQARTIWTKRANIRAERNTYMGAVAFFVVAHQDDWQLFRGEQAWDDLAAGAQIVIICVTAGDSKDPSYPGDLWRARERGSVASCQVAIDGAVGDDVPLETVLIDGAGGQRHEVTRARYKNSTNYFMRIPESGNSVGGPLQLLLEGDQPVTTVDGSTTYSTWNDLTTTLRSIMEAERQAYAEPNPWFNTFEWEQPIGGPFDDNPDHVMVGSAVRDAELEAYNKLFFYGYRPPPPWQAPPERTPPGDPTDFQMPESTDGPLSAEQIGHKRAMFLAYCGADPELMKYYDETRDIYESFLIRTYFHVR